MLSNIQALSLTTRSEGITTANYLDEQIAQLQDQILDRWGATEAELGPLFYELRGAIKAQGSRKGLGFTAWLAEHGIPRTTAIRWAGNYALRTGKKERPVTRRPAVRRDIVPGGTKLDEVEEGTPTVQCILTLQITEAEQDELLTAWDVLGAQRSTRLIFDTLTQAAKVKSGAEALPDPFKEEPGELIHVGQVPAPRERLTFLDNDSEVV